ncbi:hypothetical protein [Antribacter gilvus]|uniref:hypothetical protein n=1 Tax=Antribacter gilvus TaxID=2304675 RepID=UPI000F7804FF|nr:hypothetical protein [Antribacter gilvus]
MTSAEIRLAIDDKLTWREVVEFAALGKELGVDPDEKLLLHHDEDDALLGISFIVPSDRIAARGEA